MKRTITDEQAKEFFDWLFSLSSEQQDKFLKAARFYAKLAEIHTIDACYSIMLTLVG